MVMTGTLLDWLTIDRIGIIFGIILGVVALFFKWKGWSIAEHTLLMMIRKEFDSEEIINAKKNLWEFCRRYNNKIGEEFEKMLIAMDSNKNSEEGKKAKELDDDRRRYVQLFDHNKRFLKKFRGGFIKDVIDLGEVKLFLKIEPMEKVKAQYKIDGIFHKELFDGFRKKYKKELKEK